jgi:hypothetical protein
MGWGKDFYVPFVAPVHSTQSNLHPLLFTQEGKTIHMLCSSVA